MRVFAPVAGLLIGLILVAWIAAPPRQPYVPAVLPGDLLADRNYWHGRTVRVSTADMIAGEGGALVYKIDYNEPPRIVVTWAGGAPANRPASVVGTFHAGTPCRVTDCRPAR